MSIKLAAKRRPDLKLDDLDAMWLEFRSHNNTFLICVVYQAPNGFIIF